MNCPYCQSPLENNATYCPYCGSNITPMKSNKTPVALIVAIVASIIAVAAIVIVVVVLNKDDKGKSSDDSIEGTYVLIRLEGEGVTLEGETMGVTSSIVFDGNRSYFEFDGDTADITYELKGNKITMTEKDTGEQLSGTYNKGKKTMTFKEDGISMVYKLED